MAVRKPHPTVQVPQLGRQDEPPIALDSGEIRLA
jgi:hypothetical protein